MRVCLEPGCPELTDRTMCHDHERQRDKARGTTTERGYGPDHRALRAEWQRRLDAGETAWCWRCAARGTQTPIDPSNWHLGHDDFDRSRYLGPECPPCNLATSGRISRDAYPGASPSPHP